MKTCRSCGVVYLTRVPDYQATGGEFAFEKTAEAESHRRDRARPVERRISNGLKWFRNHVLKRNRALALAVRHAGRPDATVVDVGCGAGTILSSMPAAFQVVGIEISPALADQTRARLAQQRSHSTVIQADALTGLQSMARGSADLVLMISYLEHEIDPLGALQSARLALRTNGHCIVKVPNFACWNLAIKKKDWCGFRFPDHVNYFTPDTLADLARRAGFRTLPTPLSQRLPTSDNMWLVLQKTADA